ncbi:hypothetical protein CPB84DRAFT_1850516 [Gymnopilus junonius]|uniref:Uncharacterized protein n=1 Tax=Gymnopilus junonius TaxID=109634 RepID=A0A9P5NFM5_GYMJU|nr:hypothetical protein CPB84DRAFT_1850516 [Gymnopilus junonius]
MTAPLASRRPMREVMESLGMDYDSTIAVGLKIRPDPLTGKVEMGDFAQYLQSNMDDPDVARMMGSIIGAYGKLEEERSNARNTVVNFSSIPVQKFTLWSIQLQFSGLELPTGEPLRSNDPRRTQEGVKQTFSLSCYIKVGPGMDSDIDRLVQSFVGLPDSNQVENFIREAILRPYPPLESYVPNMILLSGNLRQHEAALHPFLDSLPAPFQWKIAPQRYEEREGETHYFRSLVNFERYLEIADEKKEEGSKAFAAKNGVAAVGAYREAIDYIEKALIKTHGILDVEMNERALNAKAVYCANCSAARLLKGDAMDAHKALKDAESAIKSSAHYVKAYVRLSRAYEALGDYRQAEESIARALRLPQLENHGGLVDHLIMLQTDGKGLPKDRNAFADWSRKLLFENESAERMKSVGGLWRKRYQELEGKFKA